MKNKITSYFYEGENKNVVSLKHEETVSFLIHDDSNILLDINEFNENNNVSFIIGNNSKLTLRLLVVNNLDDLNIKVNVPRGSKFDMIVADFSDYNAPASRKDFAVIMDSVLADMQLPVISSIEDGSIPDVAVDAAYCAAVYRLYEAGILTGSDTKGSFFPDSTMTRGEAAALVSRIVDPALRKSITLTKPEFVFEPVAVTQLQNYGSLKKKCTDEEFQAAYDVALEVVEPLAELSLEDQLMEIAVELRQMFENGMSYSMTDEHYNDPYGYFVLGSASCAGCTRATGLCLNILGISYEHVNEGQWSHQWCRVNVNGVYWICDAYGLYCGPEPAPYEHPYF